MFWPQLLIALSERLLTSPHPVERDIGRLLTHSPVTGDCDGLFRLQRYHRKIDVAHKLMTAYDVDIDKATSQSTVSRHGYLGLALVFMEAARNEHGAVEASRANTLRWANSALNCLDHVDAKDPGISMSVLDAELQALVRKGCVS